MAQLKEQRPGRLHTLPKKWYHCHLFSQRTSQRQYTSRLHTTLSTFKKWCHVFMYNHSITPTGDLSGRSQALTVRVLLPLQDVYPESMRSALVCCPRQNVGSSSPWCPVDQQAVKNTPGKPSKCWDKMKEKVSYFEVKELNNQSWVCLTADRTAFQQPKITHNTLLEQGQQQVSTLPWILGQGNFNSSWLQEIHVPTRTPSTLTSRLTFIAKQWSVGALMRLW